MRRGALLAILLTIVAAWPALEAGAISRRKECRQSCGAAIDACVAGGGKRRKCKRQTLKRCRQQGLAACATTTTTTSLGGATTTSPGGSTTTSPDGTSTTSPGGSTTTSPGGTTTTTITLPGSVNNCTVDVAEDRRAPGAIRTIAFTSYYYSPRCMRITAGQAVTFMGVFSSHPLRGGTIVDMMETPDPSSPITYTSSGTSKAFVFPAPGTFPFYCDFHGATAFNMFGAVFVDP